MGGNALLYAKTERKSKNDYYGIINLVIDKLSKLFPAMRLAMVKSVYSKSDFGDADILIENTHLPTDWIYQVQQAFQPNELYINRLGAGPLRFVSPSLTLSNPDEPVRHPFMSELPRETIPSSSVSFDVENFQIDLINTQQEDWEIAQVYYAYNDLGNLMGRIADRMGYKYGWDGLWKKLGEGNDVYAWVLVSRNPKEIFNFLGYDYERYKLGFETFENMFEFAASTQWFQRAPYQFENRNHKDRVRDLKRSTYNAFVNWIEDKPWLDKHTWVPYERDQITPEREHEKATYFHRGMVMFPEFRERVVAAHEKRRLEIEAKKVWNGGIVGVATGLSGEALGTFMRRCRDKFEASSFTSFNAWVVEKTPEQITSFIMDNLREIA